MRALLVLIVLGGVARAGVDDDVDDAAAWCDGRLVTYDEGAIVGSGERVDVRAAAFGCRGGVTWAFVIGAWADARVNAGAVDRDRYQGATRQAEAIIHGGSCGAGRDPTDVVITADGERVRCAAWLDARVPLLAGTMRTPHLGKPDPEDESDFEDDVIIVDDDFTPRF